jgi:hypothetical protein
VRPVWITVECEGCGTRSRVEAPVPDVRARVGAIELLLREGLGRPPQAEEASPPSVPANAEAVNRMSWEELKVLGAAFYADEIVSVANGGDGLLRERLAALGPDERRILREALVEPELV